MQLLYSVGQIYPQVGSEIVAAAPVPPYTDNVQKKGEMLVFGASLRRKNFGGWR